MLITVLSNYYNSFFRIRHFAVWMFVSLLNFSPNSFAQFYQGTQMSFGKNGVQYEDFVWSFFRYENYDIYFYVGGQELAQYTAKTAEVELKSIEKLLDYKLVNRMQFIIFNKFSDLKQSNIGLSTDEPSNTGGYTKIVGNKVFLYFDGTHDHLRRQIRAGVSKVLIDQILYGGDLRDRFQNAALLTVPPWYVDGLISYIAYEWNPDIDNRVRDGVLTGKYKKFNRLSGPDAIYAGHSIWRYIVDIYGESTLSNLLYMTRINRNIESGYLFVLGVSLKNLTKSWLDYYQRMYLNSEKDKQDILARDPFLKKTKPNRIYSPFKISGDGKYAAYVTNKIGRYKVYFYDTEKQKAKRIAKGGYKSITQKTDESYPLLTWHFDQKTLAVIREHKGEILMGTFNAEEKKFDESPIIYFEKILDFSFSPDGQTILLSAVQRGQSDIFTYHLRTFYSEQITKDFYDDLTPRFVQNGRYIAFSSNRTNDTLDIDKTEQLPVNNNFDIFLYDPISKSRVLKRMTNTPYENERQPASFDTVGITYLSDQNGIYNRYSAYLDSVISSVDTTEHYRYTVETKCLTNFPTNILHQEVNLRSGKFSEILFSRGKYRLYTGDFNKPDSFSLAIPSELQKTAYKKQEERTHVIHPNPQKADTLRNVPPPVNAVINPEGAAADTGKIDINNYVFQSEFQKGKKNDRRRESENTSLRQPDSLSGVRQDSSRFSRAKQRVYYPIFSTNYFVSQIDNSLLNATYQTFTGDAFYFNPGLTALFKIGLSDVMEDHKFTAAMRNAIDQGSTEYFLSYENLKRRLDRQYIFYRQGRLVPTTTATLRIHTYDFKYLVRWPLNDVSSLKGTLSLRNDRTTNLSTDLLNLRQASRYENWASLKGEYIYDNTINTGLNLYNGLRFKIFGEVFKQLDTDPEFYQGRYPWLFRGLINETPTDASILYVIGADFRHYLRIHRDIIWANRLATSTSFGTRKLIYYLGAVDNWLKNDGVFNKNIQIDYTQKWAYQAVATNLRGFQQNIRNGNSFAVFNSELRIPLFKYLFSRPIKSDFIRNFQIVGFGDVGTAWTGKSPYDENNSLNKEIIKSGPLTITLITQREPIVAGTGFGLRTRIFGYFIRTDWAWGYDDGVWTERPTFYLSLSLDF